MNRVQLLLEHKGNSQLLCDWLSGSYEVVVGDGELPGLPADLYILDGPGLAKYETHLRNRRNADPSVFLPALLIASRRHAGFVAQRMWTIVDEVVFVPVNKIELEARVEILLRTRRLSVELRRRSEDLEAFVHAMTHDLRAPLRSITGFTEELMANQAQRLDDTGRHQLQRIAAVTGEMWGLINALVEFSRLGRKAIRRDPVPVADIVLRTCRRLEKQIAGIGAVVSVAPDLGTVLADPNLLQIATDNLVSNAVKFAPHGTSPQVRITSREVPGGYRIEVADNGIGIAMGDQERIFAPFVRLHGIEEYPGIGLGLPSVRKVIEIMGGHTGVSSVPGKGSLFWIELPAADHESSGN